MRSLCASNVAPKCLQSLDSTVALVLTQPQFRRYVTALNNLGDAYEKAKRDKEALETYQEALAYAPGNKVASSRVDALRARV